MIINTPDPSPKILDCYDFTFVGGFIIPVTLDLAAGDTIDVGEQVILVNILERPSLSDPDKRLPPEDIVIQRTNLLAYQHRLQEVYERTPEQEFEFQETLLQATSSVN